MARRDSRRAICGPKYSIAGNGAVSWHLLKRRYRIRSLERAWGQGERRRNAIRSLETARFAGGSASWHLLKRRYRIRSLETALCDRGKSISAIRGSPGRPIAFVGIA
jgi:hypothetical protein